MHARIVKTVLGSDTDWEMQRIVDVLTSVQKTHPGFIDLKLLAKYDLGEYVVVSFWETHEAAEAAYQAIRQQLEDMIGSHFQWEPMVEYFEVYVPKAVNVS